MGSGVRDYSHLDVWRLADEIRRKTRPVLLRPCFESDRDLRDQLRRCAERPCPNIAEGFERYHPLENARFVRIAKASFAEMMNHLDRAVSQGFIADAEAGELSTLCRRARGAATAYIRYLESASAPGVPRTAPRERRK